MQVTVYDWLGKEWTALRAEGIPRLGVEDQTRDIFRRFDGVLGESGLSLANTMRTRLWARNRESRDRGSRIRAETLTGAARSASSSFIAPAYLDSDAGVAVELWAMRSEPAVNKHLIEYEPAIVPLRYLSCESVVALSGVTSVLPSLPEQIKEILVAIEQTLHLAGVRWEDAVKIACTLHRSQSLEQLRGLLEAVANRTGPIFDYDFADGYSTEGKLIEIEVTLQLPA